MRLTPSQLDLLGRSAGAFAELVPDEAQRVFVLGPEGESLATLFAVERDPDHSSDVRATDGQLRSVHALLVTLLALLPSERECVERVGYFRANVSDVALGLRHGYAKAAVERG
ncbi:hypothetical protein [Streptomyces sp. NPDC002133]|uniref:hypothetical protein n=1 Tax=Streptomyces sp. NPDC002133 TaxID=3154409 RepID=UPI003331996C